MAGQTTRRKLIKSGLAAGVMASVGPWYVKDALSSSGLLKVMMWSDYLPQYLIDDFKKETGIRIVHIPYGSDEELMNKLIAAKGRNIDLVGPSALRALQWKPLDLLRPYDLRKINLQRINQSMLNASIEEWTWNGELHHLPYLWGTEGLAWRTDQWHGDPADISYGDLWKDDVKGRIMGRPHSMMLGIGLYLDAIGEVKSNRMRDAYADEDRMRAIWSKITEFAIDHKDWVKLFWDDADAQIGGLMRNGVILGQTADGPALSLKTEGKPVSYVAPKEGALAWLNGLSIPKGARRLDQVYAFLDYIYRPEVNGRLASETGYNTVVNTGEFYLSDAARQNYIEAYPGHSIENLWWWPSEPVWYAKARAGYRDRFIAAW